MTLFQDNVKRLFLSSLHYQQLMVAQDGLQWTHQRDSHCNVESSQLLYLTIFLLSGITGYAHRFTVNTNLKNFKAIDIQYSHHLLLHSLGGLLMEIEFFEPILSRLYC